MNEAVGLLLALAVGVVLGAIFFGGLWWTIRKGIAAKTTPVPALLFLGSLLLRTGIVLAGFYWAAGGHWERLTACLAGFVMARLYVTRLTSSWGGPSARGGLSGRLPNMLSGAREVARAEAPHAP
jgi:F1F0 ATPase subunit 2